MVNPSQFTQGTLFKIKGDPSVWEVLSVDGEKIQALNTQNQVTGNIPMGNVVEILNMAKAIVESDNITISQEKPKSDKKETKKTTRKTKKKKPYGN